MYEDETGIKVVSNFDGSQALRTQIEHGAYADVFASANNKQMNALKDLGLMNNSSVSIFTRNKLSLIIPKDNPAEISNLRDIVKPGVKIVIGTKDVPVGDYALQIIDKLGNDSAYGPEYKEKVLANIISHGDERQLCCDQDRSRGRPMWALPMYPMSPWSCRAGSARSR